MSIRELLMQKLAMAASCDTCGKSIDIPPYRIKRLKNGINCSVNCAAKARVTRMLGKLNHQYGVKGPANKSFKGQTTVHHDYINEYVGQEHPFADRYGRVKQHRLVAERAGIGPIEAYEIIKKNKYLRGNYDVHHIDENKKNNDIKNLQVLLRSDHALLHGQLLK